MKSKNMTLMVVAVGCGLVAAFLTAQIWGKNNGPEMMDVLVAKKELPVGTILEEKDLDEMVSQVKMPKGSLPADLTLISNKDELKGKKLNRTLKPGNYFAPNDVGPDSGIKLPEGKFKYAVKVDGVKAVAGFVQPGDHVDVQLTESMPNGKAKSGFVLRDVLVLAVDTSSRRAEGGQEARPQVNSVSVAVTSEESLYLSAAEKRGEVKFVLRDTLNHEKKNVAAIDTIPGFDKETQPAAVAAPEVKMVSVVVVKADVPLNEFITGDNVDKYFATRKVPEGVVTKKAITDLATLREKFITKALEADQFVFSSSLSDARVEIPVKEVIKEVRVEVPATVKADEIEVLPTPREAVVEGPRYPRKFEQIINNQRVWFLETAPGEFRKLEGETPDLKNVPTTSGVNNDKTDEKKPTTTGEIAA